MATKAARKPKPKSKTKIPDLRQLKFLELYFTPGTRYFNNALQSALKAGYTQEYSENILNSDLKWLREGLLEIMGKPTDIKNLAAKARKVLNKSLDDPEDKKLAQDTAKFVADRTDPEFTQKQKLEVALPKPLLGGVSVSDHNGD